MTSNVRVHTFLILWFLAFVQAYDIVREYSGIPFFDEWDFYGNWDNLTLGDVWWLDMPSAFSQRLAYINTAGNAVIRVDNDSYVPMSEKRNSVRITSKHEYGLGSLWIIDVLHLPFGCSVWPAFWTMGPTWPDHGEIDIIEVINRQTNNQMALHTLPGCTKATDSDPWPFQAGKTKERDCSTPEGCLVEETSDFLGSNFAATGGGVWAAQFDVSGIYIWFWPRQNVPPAIRDATSTSSIDVSSFGMPSGSFPASGCNIPQFFTPQKLVLDITLCGIWAGLPDAYAQTCGGAGPTGICYNDMVVGEGSKFNDAFFEISYIRAYTTGGQPPAITPTPAAAHVAAATLTTTITAENTTAVQTYLSATPYFSRPDVTGRPTPNAAYRIRGPNVWFMAMGIIWFTAL